MFKQRLLFAISLIALVLGSQWAIAKPSRVQADGSFVANAVTIGCTESEATIAARNGPRVSIGAQTLYIGYAQVTSVNKDPRLVSFTGGVRDWCRSDYEITGDDNTGYGLYWTGAMLYGVFSATGTQGQSSQDFRRFATSGWLKHYTDGSPGGGGGAKVAIIARINYQTGDIYNATFVTARTSDNKTNSLVIDGLTASGLNLVVEARSWWSPRNVDRSRMTCPANGQSPFNYTLTLAHDLMSAVRATSAQCEGSTFGDTLATFNTGNNRAALLSSPVDLPPTSAYTVFDTGAPITGQWVMGDWNGDGLKTAGVFKSGAFYFTNDYGQSGSWSAVWIGPNGVPVAGRFNGALSRDCIGVVEQGSLSGLVVFVLWYTCDYSTVTPPISYQWLSQLLPTAGGFSGTFQFGAGDYNRDGVDTIAVRRTSMIAFTNTPPTTINSAFDLAQYWGTPSTSGEGLLVVGDWNGDGLDSFGVLYGDGTLYRRHDVAWNSGLYHSQRIGLPIGTPLNATSWRAGGGSSGASEIDGLAESAPQWMEAEDGRVRQVGEWVEAANPAASSGTVLVSTTPAAELGFTFVGTALEIGYLGGPDQGAFTVLIDDVAVRTIIAAGEGAGLRQTTIAYLPPGVHTARIVVADGRVTLDGFGIQTR